MPNKTPFFYSKRAEEKFKRQQELEEKAKRDGAPVPPTVNNYHTVSNTSRGKSKNVHLPLPRQPKNEPVVAKSLNVHPPKKTLTEKIWRKRKTDDTKSLPTVNGKQADKNLIHKPAKNSSKQKFFPVIKDVQK